jgi:hypothetical protein
MREAKGDKEKGCEPRALYSARWRAARVSRLVGPLQANGTHGKLCKLQSGPSASGARATRPLQAMSVMIEMVRDARAPGGRNRFSCSLPTWELFWDLGRAFGWRPRGTTYVMVTKGPAEEPARRNYEPSGSQDQKRIDEEDAMAWARALDVAKSSPHLAAMIEARSHALRSSGSRGSELLPGVLDEFIEFAYGGAFEFAVLD